MVGRANLPCTLSSAFTSIACLLIVGLCASAQAGDAQLIKGALTQGKTFQRSIGDGLYLWLLPQTDGWDIQVGPYQKEDFAAVVTPPFHGPNPLGIYGWHFTPDGAEQNLGLKNVREFRFVLSKAAYDAEFMSLEDLLYGSTRRKITGPHAGDQWGTHKMGHCWLKPDEVILNPGTDRRKLAIKFFRFTAECALRRQ